MAGKDFVHEQRKNASKQKKDDKKQDNKKGTPAPQSKSIAKMNKSTGRNR